MQMRDQNPIKWLTVGNFDVTLKVNHYNLLSGGRESKTGGNREGLVNICM